MKNILFATLFLLVSSIGAFAHNGTNNGKEKASSNNKDINNGQPTRVSVTERIEVSDLAPEAIKNLIKLFPNHQMGEITKHSGSEVTYYVNLRNENETFLVAITTDTNVSFFKAIK